MKPTPSQVLYKVTAFALPISAAGIVNMLSNFIAMMMLARLGQAELAAGALAITSNIAVNASLSSIFYAVGILIGFGRGKGEDTANVGRVVRNGFWLSVMLTVPFGIILWNLDKLLLFVGEDPQLVLITSGFFHFSALSLLPVLLNVVVAQFYAGIGNTRFTLYVSLASLPLIVVVSYVFILGNFGSPQLGLSGVTCATLVVQVTLFLAVMLIMSLRDTINKYHFFTNAWLPDWTTCKSIFTLGIPIGMQFGGEIAAMTASTYMMGHFGETPLAAGQVVTQYSLFIVMIFLGLSQASSILISEAFGARNSEMIQRYLNSAMLLFGVIFILAAIVFIGMPDTLTRFYIGVTGNEQLDYYIRIFFALNVAFLLFDGFRNLFSGALRGLHDSRVPMRIGIITMWLMSLPISYLIGFTFHYGPIGLRVGFISGIIYCAFWLWIRFRRKMRFIINIE